MAKITINTEIQRIDVYCVIFDDTIWNQEKLKEFNKEYVVKPSLEIIAQDIAQSLMRHGTKQAFHEGYGYIMMYRDGERIKHHWADGHPIMPKDYVPGLAVHILSEDDDFECTTTINNS